MKKSLITILIALALSATFSITLTSCGGGSQTEEVAEAVYACPMHPEVTGKEGDTCNQCGMALEKVEGEADADHEHMDH